jgi:transposase
MFYTGIDQHKRDSYLATYDADGCFVKQGRVRNTRAALTAYLTTVGRPHRAVVESTGGWYWLADLLADLDIELRLAHATRLKAISAAKVKTDRIDADTLATLLRADLIPEAHMIARDRRGSRDLLRARLRLVAKRASGRNNIARLFEQANVVHTAALDATTRLQVTCYEQQITLLTDQIRTLERTLQPQLLPTPDVQRLLWIPGIGKINAFTLVTEIDGIARFPSVNQFLSYCRLVPGADNSAGRTRHRSGHKAGNRYLKLAFSHAAVRAVQYFPVVRGWYQRQLRRKPKRIAQTRVAIELARIVYHVLRTEEPYNEQFKGTPLTRRKALQWPRLASPPCLTEREAPPLSLA